MPALERGVCQASLSEPCGKDSTGNGALRFAPRPRMIQFNMSNDTETTRYYVRGTDPTNDEQIAFECVGLGVANAKAAELRMGAYRDVILSLVKASEAHDPTS